MIRKIISGGQTGADRGGLDAAIACEISYGGWCPRGRFAEDEMIPTKYDLKETNSEHYAVRTKTNVKESDATVIFSFGAPGGGSFLTVEMCVKLRKPYLIVDLDESNDQMISVDVVKWMKREFLFGDIILNVAGSRESHARGIHERVRNVMTKVLMSSEGAASSAPTHD